MPKSAPRKWHVSASRERRVGVPPHPSSASAYRRSGRPAAAGSKLVIALSGTSQHGNRPPGGRGTVQIPATNLQRSRDVLAAGIRFPHCDAPGLRRANLFGGQDGGAYAAFSGHRTTGSGRGTACRPWPVGGRLRTACPPATSRPNLTATERPPLTPAECPVTGIRGGLHPAGAASRCKEGPPVEVFPAGPATELSPTARRRECVGWASCPAYARDHGLDRPEPTGPPFP